MIIVRQIQMSQKFIIPFKVIDFSSMVAIIGQINGKNFEILEEFVHQFQHIKIPNCLLKDSGLGRTHVVRPVSEIDPILLLKWANLL